MPLTAANPPYQFLPLNVEEISKQRLHNPPHKALGVKPFVVSGKPIF